MTVRISLGSDVGERMMVIYLDVLGNEKREVKRAGDFGAQKVQANVGRSLRPRRR
jgi:hypothetical protein